jgi:hypothetical protein
MAANDAASAAPPATSTSTSSAMTMTNKREAQMKKLKDANSKYKDLLKMAKGRIQSQEEELEKKKGELFHYITLHDYS